MSVPKLARLALLAKFVRLAIAALAIGGTALSPVVAFPVGSPAGRAIFHSNYDTVTRNYFAAMTVQPSTPRKALLASAVVCIENNGLLAYLDMLTIHAMHDEQAGRVSITPPNLVMIAGGTGSPTFTTDRGYQADGTSNYLKSPVTMNSASHYSVNSGTVGVWITASPTTGVALLGSNNNTNTAIFWSATNTSNRVNGSTSLNSTGGTHHHFTAVRVDSTTLNAYTDGSNQTSGTSAADASLPASTVFTVGAGRSGFGNAPTSVSYYGQALTSTQVNALHSCLLPYLSAIGAQ